MTYEIADILRDVRVILDQNQIEESIIDDHDTLKLDELIHTKIFHAARELLESSDVSLIDTGRTMDIVTDGEDKNLTEVEDRGALSVWRLDLPDNYLRLLSLKMSDWRRAVHGTIPFESEEYSRLQSRHIGITGNPERPVVAECVGSDDRRWLEIYTSSGDVTMFRYCAVPECYGCCLLDFPERLYRQLIYRAAALVEVTWKDNGLAQSLMGVISGGGAQSQGEQ